jgi:hypothetical protein
MLKIKDSKENSFCVALEELVFYIPSIFAISLSLRFA